MDPRTAATPVQGPDAVAFVRFCYERRRVGWPELYDEMCAVAGRALFHGYDADDLARIGIGLSLFDMPGLAALVRGIVAEEQARRRSPATPAAAAASAPVLVAEHGPGPSEVRVGAPAEVRVEPPVEVRTEAPVELRPEPRIEPRERFRLIAATA